MHDLLEGTVERAVAAETTKKSPISSTKLHKIKTAEPILSDVSAEIFRFSEV